MRTALHDWHVSHGARMVDFAGWDMPVIYTGIVEEHQAVRTACGIFDIGHMGRLEIAGPDALELVQYLCTNNAATMKEGQVRYSLICNEIGGVQDDVLIYRWSDRFWLVVNAANRQKILDCIFRVRGTRQATVTDNTLNTGMVAVQGPKSLELCRGLVPVDLDNLAYYFAVRTTFQDRECWVSRTGYTGEDGVEFVVPVEKIGQLWLALVERGCRPCGLGARDTLRLEAAMPLYGHELNEEIDPFQAGLGWAVKFDKGDFLGRDGLQIRQQDSTRPRRVGLELAGKRIAREGYPVLSAEGQRIGTVTSGTLAPTLQKSIAMAYVQPQYTVVGTAVQVDIRGKTEPAQVVKLPFYSRKK
ncbi:MAG: glycine cleavage system aminomethyltransferase GcvT [Gemmatales bacterium]|nr:glycine cleavage system aminomethyltransferase GcvT [Gemmatales bacterium]MDW8386387.1 glycine cleavage system aminomethyltransferase GcvT [Gemmatales bacterium]